MINVYDITLLGLVGEGDIWTRKKRIVLNLNSSVILNKNPKQLGQDKIHFHIKYI